MGKPGKRKATGGKASRIILPPVVDSDDESPPSGMSRLNLLGTSALACQAPSLQQLAWGQAGEGTSLEKPKEGSK
ncbi:hypothetical protein RSAG8_09742, partial [Rhizoctonia solani AG-8 WAC10335]